MNDVADILGRITRPLCIHVTPELCASIKLLLPRVLGLQDRIETPALVAARAPVSYASMEAPLEQPADKPATQGVIAIVPVFGTLVSRGAGMQILSGQSSYDSLKRELRDAAADSRIVGILLDVNSPGGEAAGCVEVAELVAKINRDKPVWAIAHHLAASAAYWIASQAGRVFATSSAWVGSIGAVCMHVDVTKADAQDGYKYTFIASGDRKLDGNPHLELQPEARAKMVASVNRIAQTFQAGVARGRKAAGVDMAARDAKATEADVFPPDEALKLGLIDAVGTMEQAIAAFAEHLTKRTTTQKESTMTDPVKPGTEAAPAPTTTATPATNVVTLDAARKEGEAKAIAYVQEMNRLCTLAGVPEKAAAFIEKQTSIADATTALLNARAAESDATAIVTTPPAGATAKPKAAATIDTQAIYAARAKAENAAY